MICDGYNPSSLALNEDGTELYILSVDELHIVSTSSMKEIDEIFLGVGTSFLMGMRPESHLLYIRRDFTMSQGTFVVDAASREITDTLDVYPDDAGFLFSSDGEELYVSQSGNLLKIDPDNGQQVASVAVPGYGVQNMCIANGAGMIYVTWYDEVEPVSGGISEIDAATLTILRSADLPDYAGRVCCIESENILYVKGSEDHHLQVIDIDLLQVIGEIETDEHLRDLVVSPDESFVYCPVFFQENYPD